MTNSTQYAMTQITFNGENIATNWSKVTVLALDGLTKKHFGHYALLKIFSLRSPSILSINVKVLVSSTRKNSFVVFDASLQDKGKGIGQGQ